MLITTVNGPPSGLGQSQLAQLFSGGTAWKKFDGTSGDFNCTTAICYGVGDKNHQTAIDLQAAINRFAVQGGFKPITTDGKLGSGTVVAAVKAAKAAAGETSIFQALPLGPRSAITVFATTPTVDKVALAAVTPWLLEGFTRIAEAKALPVVAAVTPERVPAPPRAQPEFIPPPEPEPEPAAAAATTPAKKPSTVIWWVAGGVAAAALVGIVGYAVYRGKKRQGLRTESTRSFKRRPRGEFAPGF